MGKCTAWEVFLKSQKKILNEMKETNLTSRDSTSKSSSTSLNIPDPLTKLVVDLPDYEQDEH